MTDEEVLKVGLRLQQMGMELQRCSLDMKANNSTLTNAMGWRDYEAFREELWTIMNGLDEDANPPEVV